MQKTIITSESSVFNVSRSDVLNGFRRGLARKNFNHLKRLDVVFVDDADVAEGSIDEGGPTREFLRLLLVEMFSSDMFEGPPDAKCLALSTISLERRLYVDAGRGIAMALLHGGPAPECLSKLCYDVIVGNPVMAVTTSTHLHEICDEDLKAALQKIAVAESLSEVQVAIGDAADVLSVLGSLRPVRNMAERDALVHSAVSYYLLGRLMPAYEQFREGLKSGGLLAYMQHFPDEWRGVFTGFGRVEVSAKQLADLFQPNFSAAGSVKRVSEARTVAYWRDWLCDLQENDAGLRPADVLVFATGADREPPLGFPVVPTINFNHESTSVIKKFPTANTCSLAITLPVVGSFEDFASLMCEGIIQAPTFGLQ